MNKIVVSPKEGVTVRHPETGMPIRKEQEIECSPQIKRFIRDGDLIVQSPKKKQVKKGTESQEIKS